jgi:hypothetical protein
VRDSQTSLLRGEIVVGGLLGLGSINGIVGPGK